MKIRLWLLATMLAAAHALAAGSREGDMTTGTTVSAVGRQEVAMFGAGCFWCSEAVFQRQDGVVKVESGYSGGSVPKPSYESVCEGKTGHAEVVRVTFDPDVVPYEQLLKLFWEMHDPTTLNRQGADVGTQYRSVIFCYSDSQRKAAEASKTALQATGRYASPIVTTIESAGMFYPAEDYHRNYYDRNSGAPYCRMVIAPKLKKMGQEKRGSVTNR